MARHPPERRGTRFWGWTVTGIEAAMAGLRGRGVDFEDYDFGELKAVDGLADFGGAKAAWFKAAWFKSAWFKDSEGNTLELSEVL